MIEREVGQARAPVYVGYREREWRATRDERLEVFDLPDGYAGASEELGQMLSAPGRFGRQQHGAIGRADERPQIARFVAPALVRQQVWKGLAAEADAMAAAFAFRVYSAAWG